LSPPEAALWRLQVVACESKQDEIRTCLKAKILGMMGRGRRCPGSTDAGAKWVRGDAEYAVANCFTIFVVPSKEEVKPLWLQDEPHA
jgi:hypothetical protein